MLHKHFDYPYIFLFLGFYYSFDALDDVNY